MQPRSEERGELDSIVLDIRTSLLQCSRVLKNAESSVDLNSASARSKLQCSRVLKNAERRLRRRPVRRDCARASMQPRSEERGELPSNLIRHIDLLRRFNAAAF